MDVVVIFPHQLFEAHPCLDEDRIVVMVEDTLFFHDGRHPVRFHRQKLMLHRASMQAHADALRARGRAVHTVPYPGPEARPEKPMRALFAKLEELGASRVLAADPVDFLVEKRLRTRCETHGMALELSETPAFLCEGAYLDTYFAEHKYYQTSFYQEQRKRLGILVDDRGSPVGSKWSFDPANREPLPEGVTPPAPPDPLDPQELRAARDHTASIAHLGETGPFRHPVTREQARARLERFLDLLPNFGPYQDALVPDRSYLFHSALSPALNIGLLTPGEVLDAVIQRANDGRRTEVPMQSLEGFVRQVLGWREYVRAVYRHESVLLRTTNHFGFTAEMPPSFYDGTTGLPPVDAAVRRLHRDAFTHHIERLMVLGNAMLLCEISPDAVYRWFMEFFVDAYDWVMVPNVYGMSQFADGGFMMTKPYISSSRYLLKMGRYEKGPWTDVWDGLFWRFVERHRETIAHTPRMAALASTLDRMDEEKLKRLRRAAEGFLDNGCVVRSA
jgi:deoxyribodipyrimidine photolyase-related protein